MYHLNLRSLQTPNPIFVSTTAAILPVSLKKTGYGVTKRNKCCRHLQNHLPVKSCKALKRKKQSKSMSHSEWIKQKQRRKRRRRKAGTDPLLPVVYWKPLWTLPGQSECRQHCSTTRTSTQEDPSHPAEVEITTWSQRLMMYMQRNSVTETWRPFIMTFHFGLEAK